MIIHLRSPVTVRSVGQFVTLKVGTAVNYSRTVRSDGLCDHRFVAWADRRTLHHVETHPKGLQPDWL